MPPISRLRQSAGPKPAAPHPHRDRRIGHPHPGKFRDDRYGKTLAEKKRKILQMAADAVKLARQFVDDVEFYAEDAGRADPAYLFEMIAAVIAAGASVVKFPTPQAIPCRNNTAR